MTNQTFTGAVRYKNHGKHVFAIGNVDTWQEAFQALEDVKDTVCHLVLVPKEFEEVEKELA